MKAVKNDEFDAITEAYDEMLKKAREDGVPLWMIQERISTQELYEKQAVIESKSKPGILKRFKLKIIRFGTWLSKAFKSLR